MSNYFRQLPDLNYVSRLPNAKISDYIKVKNLFKKGKLREDIFQNVSFFTKYKIKGDDRPDNVAFEFYGDSKLDWLRNVSNQLKKTTIYFTAKRPCIRSHQISTSNVIF